MYKRQLPEFSVPDVPWNFETVRIVLPFAFILAGIGLIESLLTLSLIDGITESRGQKNRECMSQGLANVVTGFFGGMGGCAMIGQSMINIKSGARMRLSGILAALFLLLFILFASSLIEQIPIAALVGVMFVVVVGTFSWSSLRIIRKVPLSDAMVMVIVSAVTVVTDLAIAVVVGLSYRPWYWPGRQRAIYMSALVLEPLCTGRSITSTVSFVSHLLAPSETCLIRLQTLRKL